MYTRFHKFITEDEHQKCMELLSDETKRVPESSHENTESVFDSHNLNDEPLFTDLLMNRIQTMTGKCFRLLRVYANFQTAGQNGSFHMDNVIPDTYTFLLYLNSFGKGGETEFKSPDGIVVQKPVRNLGLLFDSRIEHRGKAPIGDGTRITIAWKLHEIPKYEFFDYPVPHCIIRNCFDEEYLAGMWDEIEFIKPKLAGPRGTGTARDDKYQILKKNKGLFLDHVYKGHKEFSTIMHSSLDITPIIDKHWFYKYLSKCKPTGTLVSCYNDGDYYKSHADISIVTCISYHWKTPKKFKGGELYFGDYEVPIENNCMLIFPSCTEHEVKPVHGEGRYSITRFLS